MGSLYDSAVTEAISQDGRFNEVAQLVVALGRALHQVGLPSHRVESTLVHIAERFQTPVEAMVMPTGQLLSFQRESGPWTIVVRVPIATVDLDRLSQLTTIADRLLDGSITPLAAEAKITRIMQPTGKPGRISIVLAYVCSAAAFSIFFGGGWRELVVSTCVGLAVGLIAITIRKSRQPTRSFELAAATAAALIGGAADIVLGAYGGWIPIAAGLIMLLPGMSLIDALEELASGELVAGAGRFAGVATVFLALTFGVVLGYSITDFFSEVDNATPTPFPAWAVAPALLVVSVGSLIRFRARVGDWGIILAASALALLGSRVGKAWLGDVAGMFLASMALGVIARLFARWARRPSELMLAPGLALLVPGSIGYQSLEKLASRDANDAILAAFQMFMIAMALVSGLLFSNAVVSPRSNEDAEPTGKPAR